MSLELQLGDDGQRAFRTNHEPRQVIAGRGLAGAPADSDDTAVGGDDGHAENVFAHRAVAHGRRAGGAGGGHAAEGGVGAGIDGEHQAVLFELGVEGLSGDAGLHAAVEVVGLDGEDAVHAGQIEGDAAPDGLDVPFHGGAGTEGHDGRGVLGAQAQDGRDFVGGLGEGDGVGRRGIVPGLVARVGGYIVGRDVDKRSPSRARRDSSRGGDV
jgi:hypothetical protein